MPALPPRLRQLAAIASTSLTLLGCHNGPPDDGKIHLRFSGFAGNPAETALMKKLVEDFNASHSKIAVTYEPVPGQYVPKLLTMLVSHTAPDVFYLDSMEFEPFLSKHVLRPLDDLIPTTGTHLDDYLPSLVKSFSRDGHVYGIPKDFNTLGLFYNKAMFDQAHLAYPDDSWTLEKFRQAAKQLTVTEDGKTRHGFALTHDSIDRYWPIARMDGAQLFGPDGRCAINSPASVAAMNYYAGLKLVDHAAIYPGEVGSSWTGDAFGQQTVAMCWEGGWLIPYLQETFPKVRYGVAKLPQGPKGRSNFLFTVAYVIPKDAPHPKAAWQLIAYLTSAASQAQVTYALPSRRAISQAYVEKHPEYRAILASASDAQPYAFGPKGDRVRDRMGEAVQEIFLGAKGTQKALDDAAADIDQMMKL
ncbi:MAG TPA: ABC transporter substrate-binding protein [Oscillatoriaceae cyanobacterium]